MLLSEPKAPEAALSADVPESRNSESLNRTLALLCSGVSSVCLYGGDTHGGKVTLPPHRQFQTYVIFVASNTSRKRISLSQFF